jgi:DNA-binding response OmpR family regulator
MARRAILLVDDDEESRRFSAEALEQAGFDVTVAADGLSALSALARRRHDLILTDFVMPRMNGWMLIKAIDTRGLAPKTPIIVMSSLTDKISERLVQMTRVDACIKKPFTRAELLSTVRAQLDRAADADLADTGDADDTWIVIANVQERLHNAVAEAIASRIDDLVDASSRTRVLTIAAEILDTLFDDRFVSDIVETARDAPVPEDED